MKIKQIGKYDGDILRTVMENRSVEDVNLLLNPTSESDSDPSNLKNIDKGVEMFLGHVISNSHIGLVVDADADGITSSSIIYQYIKEVNPNIKITYFIHKTKAHGLTDDIMNRICETDIDFVIIPDAGSNDLEQIARLSSMDIEVLIIDHHEVSHETEYGILINNQLSDNEEFNKNLVGAGMVYKFIQHADIFLKKDISHKFYDLVAVGQIGDASDVSENEVRNLIFKGINNLTNPFIKLVMEEHFDSLEDLAPIDFSFSIIPLINSVVRVGTLDEREFLFNAINNIYPDQKFNVVKRKKNKSTGKFDKFDVVQTYNEYAFDICKRVKSRQATMLKKAITQIKEDIKETNGFVVGILETSDWSPITGLIANKLSSEYQKPALVLHEIADENGELKMVGSGRGNEKIMKSFKDWCNDSGLFDYASGHANAFGVCFSSLDLEKVIEKGNKFVYEEFYFEVDALLDGKVDKDLILTIDNNKRLFGGKVSEPLIGFKNIKVNKDFIRKRGSILTFFEDGVEFISFGTPEGEFEKLTGNFDSFITMDFVGRASKSSWGSRETPQLILSGFNRVPDIVETKEKVEENVTVDTIVF